MKRSARMGLALVACAVVICTNSVVFADEVYIPNNEVGLSESSSQSGDGGSVTIYQSTPSQSDDSDDLFDTSNVQDVTEDLFDPDDFKIKAVSDNKFVKALNSKAMMGISMLCGIFPALVLGHMIVDVLCIMSPLIRGFFVNRKHQYFSDEVAKAYGFSLQSGGGAQGAYAPVTPPPATPAAGQQASGNPVGGYVKSRLSTIGVCLFLIVLCGSGQLFRSLSWIINIVMSLIAGVTG